MSKLKGGDEEWLKQNIKFDDERYSKDLERLKQTLKDITYTLDEADLLIHLAKKNNCKLQVGHVLTEYT